MWRVRLTSVAAVAALALVLVVLSEPTPLIPLTPSIQWAPLFPLCSVEAG